MIKSIFVDKQGDEVDLGHIVTSNDYEKAVLSGVDMYGKVYVEWLTGRSKGTRGGYYPSVFNLNWKE